MANSLAQVQYQLHRIEQLIPPGEDRQEYLRLLLDTHLASISPATPMGIVPPSLLSATQIYASARIAVEQLDDLEQLAATPEGIVALGAIEWLQRPALALRDGRFDPVTAGEWRELSSDAVEMPAKSVCRIDIGVDGYFVHVGTGFVVGDNGDGHLLVMTNAHVIDEALQQGWPSTPGLKLACDFARYSTNKGGPLYPLDNRYVIHPHYDLALLYLPREQTNEINPLPAALAVSSQPPISLAGLRIGVMGHPSFDARRDQFPKYFGFGDEFGIKRFSPGNIRSLTNRYWRKHNVNVFLHDATTLSGSSGSCVLDLSNMRIIGLHFGGWPMPFQHVRVDDRDALARLFYDNGAVPLWTLKDDPFLERINFV